MPEDNKRSARRLWVWPVAVLVSFPIGGYLADLVVDGVDSAGAALVGGLIAGLIIGAAEWFALRRWISWLWIAATTIGMATGLTAGAALVDYGISRADLLIMGAVTGLGVGGLQAIVLGRSRVPGSFSQGCSMSRNPKPHDDHTKRHRRLSDHPAAGVQPVLLPARATLRLSE